MDKKVYEGYKKTSSTGKSTADASATDKPVVTKAVAPKPESSKTPNAQLVVKAGNKPRIALFIDVDNAAISRENLLEILFYVNGKYQIELCKLYGFSEDTMPGIREIAAAYNVTTVGKMKFKQTGVNCLDSRLLIDAYECAINNRQNIDMIFVWCYPCDLEELFEKITDLGINTATIDNQAFDCKNKFVSQRIKLYSPYEISFEQSTYGQVQNEPSNIQPSEKVEPATVTTEPTPTSTTAQPIPEPKETATDSTPKKDTDATQPAMIDGVVPPVLPRRSIPERSNPNAPKKPEPEPEAEESNEAAGSLVEEIARKLNIPMPSSDDISNEMARMENISEQRSGMFMDMLKQAGFGDLMEDKKTLKYEDTIGDL